VPAENPSLDTAPPQDGQRQHEGIDDQARTSVTAAAAAHNLHDSQASFGHVQSPPPPPTGLVEAAGTHVQDSQGSHDHEAAVFEQDHEAAVFERDVQMSGPPLTQPIQRAADRPLPFDAGTQPSGSPPVCSAAKPVKAADGGTPQGEATTRLSASRRPKAYKPVDVIESQGTCPDDQACCVTPSPADHTETELEEHPHMVLFKPSFSRAGDQQLGPPGFVESADSPPTGCPTFPRSPQPDRAYSGEQTHAGQQQDGGVAEGVLSHSLSPWHQRQNIAVEEGGPMATHVAPIQKMIPSAQAVQNPIPQKRGRGRPRKNRPVIQPQRQNLAKQALGQRTGDAGGVAPIAPPGQVSSAPPVRVNFFPTFFFQ
jgi:hypothetical protein